MGLSGKYSAHAAGCRVTRVCVLLSFLFLALGSLDTKAQEKKQTSTGDRLVAVVSLTSPSAVPGAIRYFIEPSRGIRLLESPWGTTEWDGYTAKLLFIPVQVEGGIRTVDLDVGRITLTWPNGVREVLPVRYRTNSEPSLQEPAPELAGEAVRADTLPEPPRNVASAPPIDAGASVPPVQEQSRHLPGKPSGQEGVSVPVGGFSKEVDVELYGSTRATSPGGLVIIRYALNSYQDQDDRMRLRLFLPEGWTLLDDDVEEREFFLEAWETVEGEIRVGVPRDARPGERHVVQAIGEVIGETGGAEVFWRVQVVRRGGLKPGAVGLTGTASIQASNIPLEGLDAARYGGVVDLSGKVSRETTLAINYRQGPRESNLTNYRIAQEETRWNGSLRGKGWMLQFGNQVNTMGNAITGPYVRGQGASFRRTEGRLVGDLSIARPTSYIGKPGGHLVRGSVGIRGKAGRVALAFSDFARPTGGYSTVPRYLESIDPEEFERLERERRALEKAARNRVQGGGLEVELQHASIHRLNIRGGWLHLSNASGDTISSPSAEVHYGLNHRRATLNARWRHMPSSLKGIHLPGDEMSLDAGVKIGGNWGVSGRAYRTLQQTVGNSFHSEGDGASLGLRFVKQPWRIEVRANQRSWSYGDQPTTARTVNVSFGVPLGPVSLSFYGDRGVQRRDTLRRPAATYWTDLRWNGGTGSSMSLSTSYYETIQSKPRLRSDLLASAKFGDWELSGGVWAMRGMTVGGDPGLWSHIGIPLTYDLLVTIGAEYAPSDWGRSPSWMGTFGIRKKVAVPIPFLRVHTVVPNRP